MGETDFVVERLEASIPVGYEAWCAMIKLKLQSSSQRISAGALPTTYLDEEMHLPFLSADLPPPHKEYHIGKNSITRACQSS